MQYENTSSKSIYFSKESRTQISAVCVDHGNPNSYLINSSAPSCQVNRVWRQMSGKTLGDATIQEEALKVQTVEFYDWEIWSKISTTPKTKSLK